MLYANVCLIPIVHISSVIETTIFYAEQEWFLIYILMSGQGGSVTMPSVLINQPQAFNEIEYIGSGTNKIMACYPMQEFPLDLASGLDSIALCGILQGCSVIKVCAEFS